MTRIPSYLLGSGSAVYHAFMREKVPVSYILRLRFLLVAFNGPELCAHHREALHVVNGHNLLTEPCLKVS